MGYTHYFTHNRDFDAAEWAELTAVFRLMLTHLPPGLVICGWDGTDEPLINDRAIVFNGDADSDLDHETFHLSRQNDGFNFCKTACKPYDLIVCAVLLAASEIAPGAVDVRSDGEMHGEDWQPARDFLRALPAPMENQTMMLTNVTYNRSERRYEVDCDGRIVTFAPGVDGRQAAFRTGVQAQNPALYEVAASMAANNPALASRIWRACEIVLAGGVNTEAGAALALVASQSSAYGDYVLQLADGLITCDCEDFTGGTAVYIENNEQPFCKHILAMQFAALHMAV